MGNKIIAVGPHYKSVMLERKLTSIHPLPLFFKPFSTLINDQESIVIPHNMSHVVAEAEVAIQLAKNAKNLEVEEVNLSEIVSGIALSLDVTSLDEKSFGYGKVYDTFTPIGVFKALNPYEITYEVFLNDNRVQFGAMTDLGLSFEEIISYCSKQFKLESGDIIQTGTPAGTFQINRGDYIRIKSDVVGNSAFYVK